MDWQEWECYEMYRRLFLRGVQALAIALALFYVLLYLAGEL